VVDDCYAITEAVGFIHVVGGENNGDSLRVVQGLDVLPEMVAGLGVKAQCRFIEEEHLWFMQEPAGDLEPPPHPAGEGLDETVLPLFQFNQVQEFGDPRFPDFLWNPVQPSVKVHVLPCGQFLIQTLVLKDNPDGLSYSVLIGLDIDAIYHGFAGCWFKEGG